MLRSYRVNPNMQQDYNVQWLGINHLNCHIDASSIVEKCKKDLMVRIGTIGDMNEIVIHEAVLSKEKS